MKLAYHPMSCWWFTICVKQQWNNCIQWRNESKVGTDLVHTGRETCLELPIPNKYQVQLNTKTLNAFQTSNHSIMTTQLEPVLDLVDLSRLSTPKLTEVIQTFNFDKSSPHLSRFAGFLSHSRFKL